MFPDLSSKYPATLLAERERIAQSGSFREQVRYDLVHRPTYAFGLLAAADIARFCGIQKIIAIEFGVANGDGLLNLAALAPRVTQETGVEIEIFGFDTGAGLPPLTDYRDHPEIWSEGDFLMDNREELMQKLPANTQIIWGDIAETLAPFMQRLSKQTPVGFVSLDVDIYTSTKNAMRLFQGDAEHCLPVTISYFDDTIGGVTRMGSLFRNRWAGQLLAIDEFNAANATRKIDIIRTLKYRRPLHLEPWLEQIHAVHMLDHPARNRLDSRAALTMREHGAAAGLDWLL